MNNTICQISKRIYGLCCDVEKNIVAHNEIDADLWAKANSIRHAHTINAILSYIKDTGLKKLNILNASGLGCGHQDFSIVKFLLDETSSEICWDTLESPNSTYLGNKVLQDYIKKLNINLSLVDFSDIAHFPINENYYDLVLLTEVAEHLDHSVFLNLLQTIYKTMKKNAIIIITTPNLVGLINRVRIAFGNGDGPYWGDGTNNLKSKLFGHIVNYDCNRLKRIIREVGYCYISSYTYNYGYGPSQKKLVRLFSYKATSIMSGLIRNSGQSIFMIAKK